MNKFDNKTVLITGATGLIGSHIVDELMTKTTAKVIALSRSEKKLTEAFKEYIDNPRFSVCAQNITDELIFEGSIDYIFHAAGPMEGKVIKNYPVDVINPNISGTINCLELLKKQEEEKGIKGRLILFSSVTVYGNITNEDLVVSEDDTKVTEPLDDISAPYSQSKRMSEVITLAYVRQFGIDAVIARFSTVYGATRFIPDTAFYEFIRKGKEEKIITLNTAGLPRRDNVYIDDAVSGVIKIAESGNVGEAYNISSNGDLENYASVDEIATVIADVANKMYGNTCDVQFKEQSKGARKPGLKLDNTKLKGLGWNVRVSLREGIEHTFENIDFKGKHS